MAKQNPLLLPIHPVCNLFPRIGGAEKDELVVSIRANGVLDAVTIWTDPDTNETWVVDGANRCEVATQVMAEGGKIPPVPFKEYKGDRDNMLRMVMAKNRDRRHLSSGQKAAITVLAEEFASQWTEVAREPGDTGLKLAEQIGSNRQYVYDCRTLRAEAPDLLKEVADGNLNIPQALSRLKKRQDGEVQSGEGGLQEEPQAQEEAEEIHDKVIRDALKVEVPEKLRAAFIKAQDYKAMAKDLRENARLVLALGETDGSAHLDAALIGATLKKAAGLVAAAMPYAVCPACGGKGKLGRKTCKVCTAAGYLTKEGYKAYEGGLEKAPEAPEGEAPAPDAPMPEGSDEGAPDLAPELALEGEELGSEEPRGREPGEDDEPEGELSDGPMSE